MTSLRASLPPAGSTLWGKERRSSVESSHGPQALITHVVIREVWKREVPSPHALYKIDVMTKSNHWFVLKRYREFCSLHKKLVASYGIPKDMLPPKKLTSKMSLKHLEKRRDALEHYLQRLVNSSTYVSSSQEILEFLDVGKHDVMAVTKRLATELLGKGERVLDEHGPYTFSVTEMYCITRQLQLPEPASEEHSPLDLGHLYSFVYHLEDLCVSASTTGSRNTQEFASHLEFDASLFKALKSLNLNGCPVRLVKGLSTLQAQLKYLTVQRTLKNMRELLIDRVVEKRRASSSGGAVASWRSHATEKLTQNRVIIQPWVQLTNLNLSHNSITMLDESMKLMPSLQSLDLSYNDFVSLDLLQLNSSSLTHLDVSHNSIHFISGSPKSLENLKSLVLDHNHLQTLKGLESLAGLIELNIASNQVTNIKEIHCLCGMSQLRYLSVDDNPLTKVKSYRLEILSIFKGRRIVLDNKSSTDDEKGNLDIWPSRSRSFTSPQSYNGRQDSHEVKRLVRSHSYEALGESSHDDDDGVDDDDDSGIDGYTPSITGVDTIVEGAGKNEHQQEDLEFNWSYYDFLDMSGNMAFPSLAGNTSTSRETKEETHKRGVMLPAAHTGNNLEEKQGQKHHPKETTLPLNTSEMEERIGEEMCQEKTESTSSTEVASEVSVNGDNNQSGSLHNYTIMDSLQSAGVCGQEDDESPRTEKPLVGTGYDHTGNLQTVGVSDQEEEEEELPETTSLSGTSDTSNKCADDLQTAGASDQVDKILSRTTETDTSDNCNNCSDDEKTGVCYKENLPALCLLGTSDGKIEASTTDNAEQNDEI